MKVFPRLINPLILAPMAGVTDVAFRSLCKKEGAALVFTEMISANGLVRNKKNFNLRFSEKERPIAFQLFGNDVENLITAAKSLEKYADIIDFNAGCPVDKVVRQGAGCALLKDKKRLKEIISALATNIRKPVTVKIRSGITKNKIIAVDIARLCEKAGASAITLHARTMNQGYSGKADWNVIKKVKNSVSIPVIGNGDVFRPEDADGMLKKTGCDYVMIGRGAIGNPFIFSQTLDYFKTKTYKKISPKEKIDSFFKYLKAAQKFKIDFVNIKLQAVYFTKGLHDCAKLREKLNKTKKVEELIDIFKTYGKGI